MPNILITPEGIQKNLRNIKPLYALCEYIWNGFDAQASVININLKINDFELVEEISVEDNGTGIVYEELINKFQPFNESKKSDNNRINHSLPHGKQGLGRLTFFSFAKYAKWETVYERNEKLYEYYIKMKKDSINEYDDNGGDLPRLSYKSRGTKVTFTDLIGLDKEDIQAEIKNQFFWFLELNKKRNFQIWINGEELIYEDLVMRREQLILPIDTKENEFFVEFIQWNKSLGSEYSRLYYLNSNNDECFKEATKLNKKSDEFHHSVFVKSSYFDDFYFDNTVSENQKGLFPNKGDIEFKCLVQEINIKLIGLRKEYLKESSDRYIENLIKKNVYPEFEKNNVLDNYRKKELDHLVETLYIAQPKIFTNLHDDNKKIMIHLLNLIMENSNKPELFQVLKQVIDLDEEELHELADVLRYTKLNNITKVAKLLKERQEVIRNLKLIVFDNKKFANEVEHVQSIVERHYWMFGEQYNLITAAEPDFEKALKGLLMSQKKDVADINDEDDIKLAHVDKRKEMDIYMIRQDIKGSVTENVVVELKRPSVSLGENQLSQVKKYMRVIKSDDRFNAKNVRWTYILIGNKYNGNQYIEGELDSCRHLGEEHLVHSEPRNNTKIYVMTWSDLFDDFLRRHDYLMSKLELDKQLWLNKYNDINELVVEVANNSARLADPIVPTH